MQLKGFDLGNCWYFDQTLGEMLNIWRFLLEKLQCIWLQIEEFTEVFFLCYRWSLWSCHGSCDAWIKVCHSYRGDGWGTFVSVLKSHPLTSPHPAAMNVSILFSWIFACTELILSRHIFWLRICEKKIVFFMFDISLFSITTLPKI